MGRVVLIRLLQTFVSLLGMSLLIFMLVRASGDPVDLMRTATTTDADLANIRATLGLDKSLPEQYWVFVSGLARGDFGQSLIQRRPVTTMIGEALPNSLALGGSAFVLGIGLALVLGVLAATRRDSWLDNGVKFLAVLGQALPGFWVAIVAIYIFSVHWQLLPTSGTGDPSHYVLPVLTLAFFLMPGMLRLVRSSMLDVLGSEYVKMARIKGMPERTVIWKHAFRNALIAPMTAAGAIFAGLITGAVILENVFAWPGVGRLLVTAVSGRDFPVVQGITVMVALVVLMINLLVDLAYAYVDPRIRL
ncbi:MAG: ABC transporter permease [Chloroflexi bacterium]|nr:ABC transporter permease [Chloroflexota bacterium]MBV9602962.1 ABC transporter permease [Chloroflexota bacterium]